MLPDEALKSMKVMLATPCYISAVSMSYTTSIYSLVWHLARFGCEAVLHMRSESLITRGRNKIVREFLNDESYTHLFFIDSDISFAPTAVCRLLLSDKDLCAGVYPLKRDNWPAEGLPAGMTRQEFDIAYTHYAFNPFEKDIHALDRVTDADGFAEVQETSTGFMCIKRDVFVRMMEAYPDLQYTPDGPPGHPLAHLHWRFFDCMVDPDSRRYLSEDYAFCRLWRDLGGKVFVDVESRLDHQGQHLYPGNLLESLKRQGSWFSSPKDSE